MNARYYNANTGQFTSRDTYLGNAYNPQTHNLYSYTGNNPTSFVDPTGHVFFLVTALIGAVVGGAIGAYHSYKTTGKVTLKSVVKGALIGGAVGLTLGAGASLALTGGLAASTAAVTSAAGSLASSAAGGLVAAGTSVANKASSAANNVVNALSKSKIAELGKNAVQNATAKLGLSIKTPHDTAFQNFSNKALTLKKNINNGGCVYRAGEFGESKISNAQFWAAENPLNPGYAEKYGVQFKQIDYIIKGKLKTGANFITRPAPGLGSNMGGALEIVTEAGSVKIESFIMP